MVKPLWLLNLLLIAVVIGLALALARSIVSPVVVGNRSGPQPRARLPGSSKAAEANHAYQLNMRRRTLAEFDSIVRGNLFSDPDEEAKQKQPARPLPPLPLLQGTIFIGTEAKAILKQGNREELYNIGDRVAGGTLSKIHVDRVVIDFGNRRAEVMLKSAVKHLPPPPPEIALNDKRVSKSKTASAPDLQNSKKGFETKAQDQPASNSLRMRRAQEIIERQQQMREAQK